MLKQVPRPHDRYGGLKNPAVDWFIHYQLPTLETFLLMSDLGEQGDPLVGSTMATPQAKNDSPTIPQSSPLIRGFYNLLPSIPPTLRASTAGKNTTTRPPSTYDKHLHPDFVLKKLYHCPKLSDVMVTELRSFLGTIQDPEDSDDLLVALRRTKKLTTVLDCEEHVHSSFHKAIGDPVAELVQNLLQASRPAEAANLALEFDVDCGIHRAISDNLWYLRCVLSPENIEVTEPPPRALALVEYKSYAICPIEGFRFMEMSAKSMASFRWTYCKVVECVEHNHGRIYPISPLVVPDSATGILRTLVHECFAPLSDLQASIDYTTNDPFYEEGMEQTIMAIIQQVWAQACKHDLTLFMISTYQHSIFMIRDRETQSLFMSDTLTTGEGPLNVLEVTLAMVYVGILDAIERSDGKELADLIPASGPTDDSREDSGGGNNRNRKFNPSDNHKRTTRSTTKKGAVPKANPPNSGSLEQTEDDIPALFLYFRVGIYQSRIPAFLQHRQRKQASENHPSDTRFSECPHVFILSLAGQGTGGDVWRAKMVFTDGSEQSVVVKIGDKDDLNREELAYERLKTCGVTKVPNFWGSFTEEGDESVVYIILEDVGSPVASIHPMAEQWMTQSDVDQVLSSLESIHNAGVAHGDLRSPNLLERKGEDGARIFTLVDFHLAEVVGQTWKESPHDPFSKIRSAEVSKLRNLLNTWVDKNLASPERLQKGA